MATVTAPAGETFKFIGRSRCDAKRKALRFWYTYRHILRENVHEFAQHCTLSPDQKVITYRRQLIR